MKPGILLASLLLLSGCAATNRMIAAATRPQTQSTPLPTATGADAENSRKLYLILVTGMRAQGSPRAALGYLDAYDRQYPNDSEASLLRGECLLDIQDYAKADVVYRGLLHGPTIPQALEGLGKIAVAQNNWGQAVSDFAEATRRNPSDVNFINNLAYAQMKLGLHQLAAESAEQAYELSPHDARIRNNLVLALMADGQQDKAQALIAAIADQQQRDAVQKLAADQSAWAPAPHAS